MASQSIIGRLVLGVIGLFTTEYYRTFPSQNIIGLLITGYYRALSSADYRAWLVIGFVRVHRTDNILPSDLGWVF